VLLKLVDGLIGLRIPAEHEEAGLDVSLHSEPAYAHLADGPLGASAGAP
jgi:ammonia channel protein AmtB